MFLAPDTVTCTSSDPEITLEFNNEVSSVGCAFITQVDWGDGSEQTFNVPGAAAGPFVLGDHKYNQNGTYKISASSTTTFGSCVPFPANYVFTLN